MNDFHLWRSLCQRRSAPPLQTRSGGAANVAEQEAPLAPLEKSGTSDRRRADRFFCVAASAGTRLFVGGLRTVGIVAVYDVATGALVSGARASSYAAVSATPSSLALRIGEPLGLRSAGWLTYQAGPFSWLPRCPGIPRTGDMKTKRREWY